MINRVVPAEDLAEQTLHLAKRLSLAPTASIGRIKQMLNATFSNNLAQQLDLEHKLQIESGKANDFKEGVHAFFEKRAPNFSGN
ncbi:MAG TPA: enoyl-CoA hydratase-related protein [Pyrinomonadaceae bacterium]|nr:enoyl-CoA hydratase-related protein [Pyrinomonadaceae bacterium]